MCFCKVPRGIHFPLSFVLSGSKKTGEDSIELACNQETGCRHLFNRIHIHQLRSRRRCEERQPHQRYAETAHGARAKNTGCQDQLAADRAMKAVGIMILLPSHRCKQWGQPGENHGEESTPMELVSSQPADDFPPPRGLRTNMGRHEKSGGRSENRTGPCTYAATF